MIRWNLIRTWFPILTIGVNIILITSCGPDLPPEVEVAYRELPNQIDFNLHMKRFYLINALPVMDQIKIKE